MSEIKVLIVEDEPTIAKDISYILEGINYCISAIAFDHEKAFYELEYNRPDIVLLDINLEGEMDGIQIAQVINERYQLPFIFLTSYADDNTVNRAKHTHPMGYIVKPFNERDLFTTLEIALHNYSQRFHINHFSLEDLNSKLTSLLTQKEFEILQGIYEGETNQQMAEKHFISLNTIKTHIKHLYGKLGVGSRWELLIALRKLLN